jgi:hypothetical protein
VSFIVARFPGMPLEKFLTVLRSVIEDCRVIRRRNLKDSTYFQFNKDYDYFEFINTTPKTLKRVHTKLVAIARDYYSRIDPSKLDPYDYIFWKNTEQPFRFVGTTTTLSQTPYNLACKYGIPLIGGATIDITKLDNGYPRSYLPTNFVRKMYGLNANTGLLLQKITMTSGFNNNLRAVVKNEHVSFTDQMRLLSYDIETYTEFDDKGGEININAQDIQEIARMNKTCEVMTVGIGLFTLSSPKPFKRICLITKDICSKKDQLSVNYLKKHAKSVERRQSSLGMKYRSVFVTGEYVHDNTDDVTEYVMCENEFELLQAFIDVTNQYHPHIITAFNNYVFDDRYMFQRMLNYSVIDTCEAKLNLKTVLKPNSLIEQFITSFSPYPLTYINHNYCSFASGDDEEEIDEQSLKWHPTKTFVPFFKEFNLKIDGESYNGMKTVSSPHVISTDVYKIILKEDAKRFTQDGRGNLNTMLEVYDVKNPYTNQPLSKTDMKISEMFESWRNNSDIYRIGLYCVQDAWICGTLIVDRNKFIDLIEMATVSNTAFKDSVFRADGIIVSNCVLGYGYQHGFAVMDTVVDERISRIEAKMTAADIEKKKKNNKGGLGGGDRKKDEDRRPMGNKSFDPRTIVGGQVRQIQAGREFAVVASDYSSMYPSNKEASNVATSSRVDDDIIRNPSKYGLEIVKTVVINDMYGIGNNNITTETPEEDLEYLIEPRTILYVKHV